MSSRFRRAGPLPFSDDFDCVLVDAPCSGLGTIRRDPDIRWRRQEADLATLARDQGELLDRAAASPWRRRRLVYATCSSEPEENEQVVDAFLASTRISAVASLRQPSGACRDSAMSTRPSPHAAILRNDLEAFFAAVLIRDGYDRRMRLGTRVWSLGKFFLLVGTLLTTFLVFFGLSMRAALRAREVKVPALVGKSVADATQVAEWPRPADARR